MDITNDLQIIIDLCDDRKDFGRHRDSGTWTAETRRTPSPLPSTFMPYSPPILAKKRKRELDIPFDRIKSCRRALKFVDSYGAHNNQYHKLWHVVQNDILLLFAEDGLVQSDSKYTKYVTGWKKIEFFPLTGRKGSKPC